MANPLLKQRELDLDDFRRIGLPQEQWVCNLTVKNLPASIVPLVPNYEAKIHSAKKKVTSLYLHGPEGVGKSCAAMALLKVARSWGYTAWCCTASQLRKAHHDKEAFDGEMSKETRAFTVDFFLLDDLNLTDTKDHFYPMLEFRTLIRNRQDAGLVTFLTSRHPVEFWKGIDDDFFQALRKTFIELPCAGPNRHKASLADKVKNLMEL